MIITKFRPNTKWYEGSTKCGSCGTEFTIEKQDKDLVDRSVFCMFRPSGKTIYEGTIQCPACGNSIGISGVDYENS